jgi:5-methylcytosine-specific restriction endonuclease McrA
MEWFMKRLFTKRQRRMLAWIAGGQCKVCAGSLTNGFHADHIVAFSNGGPTTTNNGQALCAECNLKKGSK